MTPRAVAVVAAVAVACLGCRREPKLTRPSSYAAVPQTLAARERLPRVVVRMGDDVYWTAQGTGNALIDGGLHAVSDGAVRTLHIGPNGVAGAARDLVGQLDSPVWLDVDATSLVWVTTKTVDVRLWYAPRGGAPVVLARGYDSIDGVALADGEIYFTVDVDRPTKGEASRLLRVRTSGGAPEEIGHGFHLHHPKVDASYVYALDQGKAEPLGLSAQYPNGRLLRWPRASRGGGAADVVASSIDDPQDLAIDGAAAYVTAMPFAGGHDGRAFRVDKASGDKRALGPKQDPVGAIAIDDKFVYWPAYEGDALDKVTLWRAPKEGGGEVVAVATVDHASPMSFAAAPVGGQLTWVAQDGAIRALTCKPPSSP